MCILITIYNLKQLFGYGKLNNLQVSPAVFIFWLKEQSSTAILCNS